jgi:alcohol dehydrogenase
MLFRAPTRTYFGAGSRHRLLELLQALPARRILLVTDPGLAATHWLGELAAILRVAGLHVAVSDCLEPNPRAASVEALAELARTDHVQAVVGFGGGSALDAAKAAAMLAKNPGRLADFEGRNRFPNPPLPFLALPTTCGTGSEVTWVSVISVPEAKAKISVKGDGMFPRYALVDPDFLTSLPAPLVAATGADALTHALEALTCRVGNPASDALAIEAIGQLLRFLPRAAADIAGDAEARVAVMHASTVAGLAFGSADVAAVHCLSETLGGLYDLPHGLLNAVLLAPVLAAHGASVEAPLARLAYRLGLAGEELPADEAALCFHEALHAMLGSLELPSFGNFGIPAEDYPEIARRAVANGSNASNPREMGEAEYQAILESLV